MPRPAGQIVRGPWEAKPHPHRLAPRTAGAACSERPPCPSVLRPAQRSSGHARECGRNRICKEGQRGRSSGSRADNGRIRAFAYFVGALIGAGFFGGVCHIRNRGVRWRRGRRDGRRRRRLGRDVSGRGERGDRIQDRLLKMVCPPTLLARQVKSKRPRSHRGLRRADTLPRCQRARAGRG